MALLVVVGSFLTLFLLVVALLGLAQGINRDATTAAQNVFNTILPVLASWVGTVLAFYFSSASQERTSDSLDRAIKQAGGADVSGTLVSEKMIPVLQITELQDLAETPPEKIPLSNLQDVFNTKKLRNGAAITRLLFVENGVFKYVLHRSTLNAFLVNLQAAQDAGPRTIADMLKDQNVLNQISKLVVFVSASATLADAKAALDKVTGAQDIIVTGSGNSTDPMLGWLSNVDLTKAAQVR